MSETTGLFLHGTYDVATPFPNTLVTKVQFPNATPTTVTRRSHWGLWEELEADPGFEDAITGWFKGGPPPQAVILPPIPFDPLPDAE